MNMSNRSYHMKLDSISQKIDVLRLLGTFFLEPLSGLVVMLVVESLSITFLRLLEARLSQGIVSACLQDLIDVCKRKECN